MPTSTKSKPGSIKNRKWQVPKFRVDELKPKANQYAVCVFVINEGERIQKQLGKMSKFARDIDIIIADGGSTDGSLKLSFLRKMGVRALLTKEGPGKLSAQMRMALAWCMDQGYEGVVVVDGNNKDDTRAVTRFMKKLDEGYDHIQGSRYIPGGKAINTPLARHIGVLVLHAPLISLASRRRHTDTTNGFRAYSARLLRDPKIAVFRDIFETYELHYYLAIRASRDGYKVTEVPVTRAYPKNAPAPTKIKGMRGNVNILKILFNAARGKYDVK